MTSTRPPPKAVATTLNSCGKPSKSSARNDSSFTFEMQHSEALGFGFRYGFTGMLHMDIVQERLEREGKSRSSRPPPP